MSIVGKRIRVDDLTATEILASLREMGGNVGRTLFVEAEQSSTERSPHETPVLTSAALRVPFHGVAMGGGAIRKIPLELDTAHRPTALVLDDGSTLELSVGQSAALDGAIAESLTGHVHLQLDRAIAPKPTQGLSL